MMERVIPTQMTGTINATYFQGLTDVSSFALTLIYEIVQQLILHVARDIRDWKVSSFDQI